LAFVILPAVASMVLISSFVLAMLIAVSRIIVGVHYPSDVIAGALLGTVLASVFVWFL
jgi:undecaprenyl-diphosphatase